jgi:hypothetical protein
MVSGSALPNTTANSSGRNACSRPCNVCTQPRSALGAAVSPSRHFPPQRACSRDQARHRQSHGCPPTSNLLEGRRAFYGADSTQVMHFGQGRWHQRGRSRPGKPRLSCRWWYWRHVQPCQVVLSSGQHCTIMRTLHALPSYPVVSSTFSLKTCMFDTCCSSSQVQRALHSPQQRQQPSLGAWPARCCAPARGSCSGPCRDCSSEQLGPC